MTERKVNKLTKKLQKPYANGMSNSSHNIESQGFICSVGDFDLLLKGRLRLGSPPPGDYHRAH